ncbi:MAG: hypothetical protein Q7T25_00855 [Sideroxyarcus sp.]|nr:hypothetical protein [Sideroxyarcus sp.]
MKFSSILVALACLALAACNPPVEEKALAKESIGNDAESTSEKPRILPECAQRNQDSTYKNGHGCSKDEWIEWQKTR